MAVNYDLKTGSFPTKAAAQSGRCDMVRKLHTDPDKYLKVTGLKTGKEISDEQTRWHAMGKYLGLKVKTKRQGNTLYVRANRESE